MPTYVSAAEITDRCSIQQAIETQRKVFLAHANGEAILGPRAILAQGDNAQFSYIARASLNGPTIVKFGTVVPSNASRNLPAVQTTVAVMDPENGTLTHFFDGEAVTQLRTVAASMAVATELVADAKKIAIVGLGHQGLAHALAIHQLFKFEELIGITNKSSVSSPLFTWIGSDHSKINGCDLIILATNSKEPIITEPISSNSLCISIGSFAVNRREVAPEFVARAASVFVDDVQISTEQCGSVAAALQIPNRNWLELAPIAKLFSKEVDKSALGTKYFFSVGLGIQDAALIEFLLNGQSNYR